MSNMFLGQKVLVRTYSAGVFYGEIIEKHGARVILKDSRQLWRYQCLKSLSLSGVAVKGIKQDESKICPIIQYREVKAIEILKVSEECRKSIEECPEAEQV
jgi:hypothetical protein